MTHGNSSSSSIPTLPSSSTSTNSETNSSQFFRRESDDFDAYFWELKGAKLAIMSFTINEKKAISVQLCMENMIVLSYLTKMGGVRGGTKNHEPVALS